MGKQVQVKYGACEWVNPDLEEGIWVVQVGFLDSCAHQLIPKTQSAVLPREATAYEGVTAQPQLSVGGIGRFPAGARMW